MSFSDNEGPRASRTPFDPQRRAALEFAVQPNSAGDPTSGAYRPWTAAFAFFNERLFGGTLPDTVFTLTRQRRVLGYFCAGAFQDRDGTIAHEISMNPSWFEARGDDGSYSTLVHEMTHLWRHVYGKKNRKGGKGKGGYHDIVWADRMESIGLMPSNTGSPGGRRTGYAMTHYIIDGGRFDVACREWLLAAPGIDWRDALIKQAASPIGRGSAAPPAASKNTRTRFVCLACEVRAWSRASAQLACVSCDIPLVAR